MAKYANSHEIDDFNIYQMVASVSYTEGSIDRDTIIKVNSKSSLNNDIKTVANMMHVVGIRSALYNKKSFNELSIYLIHNRYVLDQFGQCMVLDDESIDKLDRMNMSKKCLTMFEASKLLNHSYAIIAKCVPSGEDVCDHCGLQFTLDNACSAVINSVDNHTFMHKECREYNVYEEVREKMISSLSRVFKDDKSFKVVPVKK